MQETSSPSLQRIDLDHDSQQIKGEDLVQNWLKTEESIHHIWLLLEKLVPPRETPIWSKVLSAFNEFLADADFHVYSHITGKGLEIKRKLYRKMAFTIIYMNIFNCKIQGTTC